MGYQVIRQPDTDLFGIFSSNTDTFVMWEATRDEVVEFFVEEATQRARRDAERVVGLVEAGKSRDAYYQFALSWDDAVREDREHGGEMSAEDTTETGDTP
ncbi:hypothetical protein [Nocardia sp. CA-290969]|uniref:hypothetical protein n=1 Tax=Nocardia sp. CA-290969 TaxID=3239986 RepID=UPI003D8B0FD3